MVTFSAPVGDDAAKENAYRSMMTPHPTKAADPYQQRLRLEPEDSTTINLFTATSGMNGSSTEGSYECDNIEGKRDRSSGDEEPQGPAKKFATSKVRTRKQRSNHYSSLIHVTFLPVIIISTLLFRVSKIIRILRLTTTTQ